jgi:Tol biopolymer transport system component
MLFLNRETMLKVISMFKWLGRLLLAGWFVGMVLLVVWNGRGVVARGEGTEPIYLPIVQNDYDWGIRDYMGLVWTPDGYFTVRGDVSQWQALGAVDAYYGFWSPDGLHFTYVADDGIWVVPLDTRQPHFVASGDARFPIWSPDSRYFVYPTVQSVNVFDTHTQTLHTFAKTGQLFSFLWSPTSHHLAWTGEGTNGDRELWLWSTDEPLPHQVAVNTANYPLGLFWSPDGNHLIYNTRFSVTRPAIFTITTGGESPTLLLEDAYMEGWVEGGERILLRHSGNLYLALPDTTGQTLFFAGVGNQPDPVISPDGTRVLFNDSNGRQHIQATTATTASPVEFGDCYDVNQWQPNGTRVSCSASEGDYGQYLGVKVGDGAATPVTPQYELYQYIYPQFLEGPTPYMATTHYTLRFAPLGYPVLDEYDGSFLFNLQSGRLKRIHYLDDTQWRVLEWRYLP